MATTCSFRSPLLSCPTLQEGESRRLSAATPCRTPDTRCCWPGSWYSLVGRYIDFWRLMIAGRYLVIGREPDADRDPYGGEQCRAAVWDGIWEWKGRGSCDE